ncbi:hypothetical protein [Marinobacter excellens]|uniref:hypothetical protein n=1 Tax=Marinobacter excellens TaxID=218670 RepID=UPI000772ECA2|nr:hypothetical protein [Marinobacter excellens]
MPPENAQSIVETLTVISELTSSKPNEWLPLYAALGGAIAGAIASFFPTWLIERRREITFAQQIECCLLAEISALVEIVDRRGYLAAIKGVVGYLRQNPEGTQYRFAVDVPSHYSRVYQDNCQRIGVIRSDIAQQVIVFHQLVDAVVQDMKPNGVFSEGATLETFEEMEVIFGEAMDIARNLLQKHN